MGKEYLPLDQVAPSNLVLNISKDGASTTGLKSYIFPRGVQPPKAFLRFRLPSKIRSPSVPGMAGTKGGCLEKKVRQGAYAEIAH